MAADRTEAVMTRLTKAELRQVESLSKRWGWPMGTVVREAVLKMLAGQFVDFWAYRVGGTRLADILKLTPTDNLSPSGRLAIVGEMRPDKLVARVHLLQRDYEPAASVYHLRTWEFFHDWATTRFFLKGSGSWLIKNVIDVRASIDADSTVATFFLEYEPPPNASTSPSAPTPT